MIIVTYPDFKKDDFIVSGLTIKLRATAKCEVIEIRLKNTFIDLKGYIY